LDTLNAASALLGDPGSWRAARELGSPIQVTRQTNGLFKIENHFPVSNARDCKFSWQLGNFAAPGSTNAGFKVLREGVLPSPDIPPGHSAEIKLAPAAAQGADALALRVDAPDGRPLWTWVWPLRHGDFYRLAEEPAEHHAVPFETNGTITFAAGDLTAVFDPQTAWLRGVQRGSHRFAFTGGPRLVAGQAALRQLHFDDDGPDAFVSAKFDGDLKSVFWRVNGNGWINCDYTYTGHGSAPTASLQFDYPTNTLRRLRWLGLAPGPLWHHRDEGNTLGVWEGEEPPAASLREAANRPTTRIYSGVRWLELHSTDGPITILNISDVPYVALGGGTLKFLDAIPRESESAAKSMAELAPATETSAPETNEFTGSLSFYFGDLP
jgi:hypothetical protein